MAEQAEHAFIKNFASALASQPLTYPHDYQQPPQNSLKKVPVLPIDLPEPPARKQSASTSDSITITFKSAKPPQSFKLPVQPTDTIAAIKSLIATQPNAPPASSQRLLLKGKALSDAKLLKEYDVKDGDTVNLMVKPGEATASPTINTPPPDSTPSKPSKHQRIPSVVLSPSPSASSPLNEPKPLDITLTLDVPPAPLDSHSTYHTTIVDPTYWLKLHDFLKSQFLNEHDALLAFEDYLRASKGMLSANEVAKIRDEVGVVGMAGT
ncbi:hypothetical protein PLICRDRAFT_42284 [Plicaturopsis crispa FD-325 SS-3]|nr:hypothetical protein PLICRDRAFT_42284 [Plicaturopsis crispa FD-325 SS-3]